MIASEMTGSDQYTNMDEKKFQRKYWIKMLANPWVILPFMTGVTDLMALWALNIDSGAGLFIGLAGILTAMGVFFTRLFAFNDAITKQIMTEMAQEAVEAREKTLDDLDRKLRQDSDPRDEECLRDLRALTTAFRDEKTWVSHASLQPTMDILSGVEQLFLQGVKSLEKSLELSYLARRMKTEEASRPIIAERERLLDDVRQTVQYLGNILAGIQTFSLSSGSNDTELSRLRDELNQNLEVARAVRQRMQTLDQEIGLQRPVDDQHP